MPALQEFCGQWQLRRTIDDRRAGQQATFAGKAVFSTTPDGLDYHEAGQLLLPGQAPVQATRRYRWLAADEGIVVLFDDGRPFHVISPGVSPDDTHFCPPDTYRVAYDFADWPFWTATWHANGPRKDYTMVSTYQRG